MPFNQRIRSVYVAVFLPKRSKSYFFLGGCRSYLGGGPIINVCTWWLVDVSLQWRFHSNLKNEQKICRLFVRLVQCATYIRKEKCLGRNSVWLDLHVQLFFPPKYWVQASPHWSFSTRCAKIKHTLPETKSKRTWMVGRLVRRPLVSFCGPAYFQG